MSLKGKIVFITGASSGIGASTAYAFAAEGAKLLLCSRRKDQVDLVAAEALSKGAQAAHAFALDVTDRSGVADEIAGLPTDWADIDILVNNAGLSRGLDKLYQGRSKTGKR
jgi:3-hydroxy acid dehydrogenase/malonic semialdehyde reductase